MSLQEAERRIAECHKTKNPELDLSGLGLTELPETVSSLSHLKTLKLGNWLGERNRIHRLPKRIAQLKNLSNLDFSDNQLDSLPIGITHLINLQFLNLSDNKLSALPNAITRFTTLITLDLHSNQLRKLPEGVKQLTNLQFLDLSDNQLSTLPKSIIYFTNLTEFRLNNNRLSTLPKGITQLTTLTILELRSNQLCILPEEIAQLTNLQYLDLSGNQLSKLPAVINQLTDLRFLALDSNQLSTLPEGIRHLTNLAILDLSSNQLDTLPEEITQLTNLQGLGLSGNQLSTLPEEITQLINLQGLYLSYNPLKDPPFEIVDQGIDAIRAYFAERAATPEDIGLYESKLLLVGEGRVGKTSLSKALRIPDYQLEDEQSTEGIDIQSWTLPKAETGLAEDFRLNVWDFGGQEIYHATHQFFLTRRSLYLLVTESRREDKHDDFYYWFNIIRLLGDNAPVVVVLNKCDQPTKELPIEEYRKVFGNIVEYQKVSCAPGHGATIAALKGVIHDLLKNKQIMPHVGERLPAIWLKIRHDLAALRDQGVDYIPYEQFLNICAQYKMVEPERVNLVDGFFHDLGIFLHFRDDLNLADTVFLNHEWVTAGVYRVLDNTKVKAQQGHFTDADLQLIWADEGYREKRRELLALMKNTKFELCYELPPLHRQRQGYLAPQLLPVDEIPYEWRTHDDNLRFEYRYDFMPKGMLARFIVKRHQDIVQAVDQNGNPQQVHWRYGVLLEWEGTRALVRERYFEKKITIAVEGPNKIGFLAIIRHSIQAIHNDFHNLQVHAMVPCNCRDCRDAHRPHFFRHEILERYLRRGRYQITCESSVEDIDIRSLLRETFPLELEREWGDHYHIHGDLVWGDKVGADKIGGHKAGGDVIDVGDIDDVDSVAIGKEIKQRGESL